MTIGLYLCVLIGLHPTDLNMGEVWMAYPSITLSDKNRDGSVAYLCFSIQPMYNSSDSEIPNE